LALRIEPRVLPWLKEDAVLEGIKDTALPSSYSLEEGLVPQIRAVIGEDLPKLELEALFGKTLLNFECVPRLVFRDAGIQSLDD
jgi:hypothetical protein